MVAQELKKMSKEQLGRLAVAEGKLGVSWIFGREMVRNGSTWEGKFNCPGLTKAGLIALLQGTPLTEAQTIR